ncbi:MAG: hypothetical protein AB7U82_22165 [Blastocatellales bacterium]
MAERNNLTAASQEQGTGSGERSAEEIRQDIAARRESITDTVDRLSDRFQRTLDWRAYVSDHPLVALGIAAGAGFLASSLASRIFKPRPTPSERMKQAIAYSFEDLTDRFRHRLEDMAPHKSSLGVGRTVKAAATGLITKAVTDYLRNRFVGGYEQYSEYAPEYARGYPAGSGEYPDSELEDWPVAKKNNSEPRH